MSTFRPSGKISGSVCGIWSGFFKGKCGRGIGGERGITCRKHHFSSSVTIEYNAVQIQKALV